MWSDALQKEMIWDVFGHYRDRADTDGAGESVRNLSSGGAGSQYGGICCARENPYTRSSGSGGQDLTPVTPAPADAPLRSLARACRV